MTAVIIMFEMTGDYKIILPLMFAVVTASVVETRALKEAGKIKVLAVMADKRLSAFPDVPTLTEVGGPDWKTAAWRTVSATVSSPSAMPWACANAATSRQQSI